MSVKAFLLFSDVYSASLFAGLLTFPGFPGYAATKWGVVGFTKSMAVSSESQLHFLSLRFGKCEKWRQKNLKLEGASAL